MDDIYQGDDIQARESSTDKMVELFEGAVLPVDEVGAGFAMVATLECSRSWLSNHVRTCRR